MLRFSLVSSIIFRTRIIFIIDFRSNENLPSLPMTETWNGLTESDRVDGYFILENDLSSGPFYRFEPILSIHRCKFPSLNSIEYSHPHSSPFCRIEWFIQHPVWFFQYSPLVAVNRFSPLLQNHSPISVALGQCDEIDERVMK